MDYNDTGIYIMTSLPVVIGSRHLVIEFIQNVTGSISIKYGDTYENPKQMMLSISNHINQLLIKDQLTNVYNRRFIEEQLPIELTCAYERKLPLSVIFADLDLFKKINDTYGHIAGDQVLQKVALIFQKNVRGSDSWVARYGGEEFLICLPGVDWKTAKKIAERLRIAVIKENFLIDGVIHHITCSFGVQTVLQNSKKITPEEIIRLADNNMYKAKTNGRNQVV